VALEGAYVTGNVNGQIAQLKVAQAEGAGLETRVEVADDLNLADRGGGLRPIRELDRKRQGLAERDELLRAEAQGAVHVRLAGAAGGGEEGGEIRGRDIDEIGVLGVGLVGVARILLGLVV